MFTSKHNQWSEKKVSFNWYLFRVNHLVISSKNYSSYTISLPRINTTALTLQCGEVNARRHGKYTQNSETSGHFSSYIVYKKQTWAHVLENDKSINRSFRKPGLSQRSYFGTSAGFKEGGGGDQEKLYQWAKTIKNRTSNSFILFSTHERIDHKTNEWKKMYIL